MLDILPYPLIGIELRRVWRQEVKAEPPLGGCDKVFDDPGRVYGTGVDNEKDRLRKASQETLAKLDEMYGTEASFMKMEAERAARSDGRDHVEGHTFPGHGNDRRFSDRSPVCAGMMISPDTKEKLSFRTSEAADLRRRTVHRPVTYELISSRLICEKNDTTALGSLCADTRVSLLLPHANPRPSVRPLVAEIGRLSVPREVKSVTRAGYQGCGGVFTPRKNPCGDELSNETKNATPRSLPCGLLSSESSPISNNGGSSMPTTAAHTAPTATLMVPARGLFFFSRIWGFE